VARRVLHWFGGAVLGSANDDLLLESGDYLLLENGSFLVLEGDV
jgi:hypothetical protein